MNDLLKRIEDAYVAAVPAALQRMVQKEKLAAAFIPYFAWEAMPEDHAQLGQEIYLLTEAYFAEKGDDLEEKSYGFAWPSIVELNAQSIGDEELKKLLLEWYTYQNDNDDDEPAILALIGKAVTSACRRLNELEWPSDKFTEDFVVFSQCMADERTDYGITASVPTQWLDKKKAKGWFETWLT